MNQPDNTVDWHFQQQTARLQSHECVHQSLTVSVAYFLPFWTSKNPSVPKVFLSHHEFVYLVSSWQKDNKTSQHSSVWGFITQSSSQVFSDFSLFAWITSCHYVKCCFGPDLQNYRVPCGLFICTFPLQSPPSSCLPPSTPFQTLSALPLALWHHRLALAGWKKTISFGNTVDVAADTPPR